MSLNKCLAESGIYSCPACNDYFERTGISAVYEKTPLHETGLSLMQGHSYIKE